jgi:hypothetical protein
VLLAQASALASKLFSGLLFSSTPTERATTFQRLTATDRLHLWLCALHLAAFSRLPSPPMLPADLSVLWTATAAAVHPNVLVLLDVLSCWFGAPIAADARGPFLPSFYPLPSVVLMLSLS